MTWNNYHELWMLNETLCDLTARYKALHDPLPTTVTASDLNRLSAHTYHSAEKLRRAVRAHMFTLEQQAANQPIPGVTQ